MPFLCVLCGMKNWKDYLRDSERAELEALEQARDASKAAYNLIVRKYKSRCESRMRAEKNAD